MSDETPNSQNPENPEDENKQESTETEGVDQVSLADEWEKMAEAGEINVDEAEAEEGEVPEASDDEEESSGVDQQAMIDEWEQMAAAVPDTPESAAPEASEPPMMASSAVEGGIDFSTLMDIPLEISVEVGNATMMIEELLHLSPNSVIELDKFISEPVDIRVSGRLIARGELYAVEGNFAIKITAIMTPQDRMKIVEDQPW